MKWIHAVYPWYWSSILYMDRRICFDDKCVVYWYAWEFIDKIVCIVIRWTVKFLGRGWESNHTNAMFLFQINLLTIVIANTSECLQYVCVSILIISAVIFKKWHFCLTKCVPTEMVTDGLFVAIFCYSNNRIVCIVLQQIANSVVRRCKNQSHNYLFLD